MGAAVPPSRRVAFPLTAVLWMAAGGCDGPPWEKTQPFTFELDVHDNGARIPIADLQADPDPLRLIHRVDVFRPRNLYPRGHEVSADCVIRYRDGRPDLPPACRQVTQPPAASGMAPVDFSAPDGGAGRALEQHDAVLSVLLASQPAAPQLFEVEPAGALPVRGRLTVEARDRYWGRFWSSCEGCLGLVWIEARWRGKVFCTRAARLEGDVLVIDVDLSQTANPPRHREAIADQKDRPLCGDLSWFEGLVKGDSYRFRP
jgi:hypothetical protein